MGKGRGTRITSRILPLATGQCFAELDVGRFPRHANALRSWFIKASHKLPRRIKVVKLDL
jgi:hypothetical protein